MAPLRIELVVENQNFKDNATHQVIKLYRTFGIVALFDFATTLK